MITVRLGNIRLNSILEFQAGQNIVLEIEGHSGTGIKGSDIACAGASAVIQTAVLGISKVAGLEQQLKQEDGYLKSIVKCSSADGETLGVLKTIIHTMLLGLYEIEKVYPSSVKIVFQEC